MWGKTREYADGERLKYSSDLKYFVHKTGKQKKK